jgi:hypothetical protein
VGGRAPTGTHRNHRGCSRTEQLEGGQTTLLGVVLPYVGIVLLVNGIWLIGQARAAEPAAPGAAAAASGAHPMAIQGRDRQNHGRGGRAGRIGTAWVFGLLLLVDVIAF